MTNFLSGYFYSNLASVLPNSVSLGQVTHRDAGSHIGRMSRRSCLGWISPLLTMSWPLSTLQQQGKWVGGYHCGLTWKTYSNIKYYIPKPTRGHFYNCILSNLQSPPHSFNGHFPTLNFFFLSLVCWNCVLLVTKFSSFLPLSRLRARDKSVKFVLCMKKKQEEKEEALEENITLKKRQSANAQVFMNQVWNFLTWNIWQ